ncbi:MAG: hypothetical protein EP319_08895 [Deltaproteobacteria bacterium]|nr:MAG: hypothetical protein EP319_08895 [Deltaproteobacteria bacterium]
MKSILSKDKIKGMLLGAHAGEALGATFEFGPANSLDNLETEIIGGGPFDWEPGAATDDMDMMMCLLRSLSSCESFDHHDLARRFVDWYETEPADIGSTIAPALAKMSEGKNPLECGNPSEVAQGNGSLMRCAPLVLFYTGDELERAAREQCCFTHGSKTCQDADILFLQSLHDCFLGLSKNEVYERALKRAEYLNKELFEYLKTIPDLEWENLPTSGWVKHTLGAAYWALLQSDNFEEGVVLIANKGNDSDTCGCVTGALLGASYGVEAIPERWLVNLEYREEILEIINKY